jgi:hypothetical protein
LAAGLVVSVLLLRPEASRGEASELPKLQRRAARQAGHPYRDEEAAPTLGEELATHGGHLALSAAAGAGYGLLTREGSSLVMAGLAFGVGYFALAYGVVGPTLGVTPPL